MANSDFWRELAISFKSVPELYEFTAFRQYYLGQKYFSPTSITEPDWQLKATPVALAEFRAMAVRGATMLPPLRTNDLAVRWLEALWKEATESPVRQGIPIVGGDRAWPSDPAKILPAGPIELRGKIDRVFQASSVLCRNFESAALQTEFEENQRNDPKNWPYVRQRYEAFKQIKSVISGPRETVPEAFLRNALAEQYGIKPEEVSRKQIQLGLADLGRYYPAISLVPSEPTQPEQSEQSPGETETTQPVANNRPDPKALRDSYFANFPNEKIKLRDLCWAAGQHYREWKRWLAGELKDGSTPDLAFRRVLTSGKRPQELSKKPRPKGWD